MKIHFVSGLPRSGSTMLIAILQQNPAFKTGMTLATVRVVRAIESAVSREGEVSILLSDEQKLALFRGVFTAIHGIADRVIIDKNHLWCAKLPLIAALFPDAKVICCVRDVSWIMDSFERLYQSNPLELAAMFNFRTDTTVYTRVSRMASSDGVVGMALDGLREAYYGAHSDRILLVDYNRMTATPEAELDKIYKFIGEPRFAHDLDTLHFESTAFDTAVGLPGLHTVRGPVKFRPRRTILPPDLFGRFTADAFWKPRPENQLMWKDEIIGQREVG